MKLFVLQVLNSSTYKKKFTNNVKKAFNEIKKFASRNIDPVTIDDA